MRIFEVKAPDGRVIRHAAESKAAIEAKLSAGYELVAEIFGHGHTVHGEGGVADALRGPVMPDGEKAPSLLTSLLHHHGDELRAWVAKEFPAAVEAKRKKAAPEAPVVDVSADTATNEGAA